MSGAGWILTVGSGRQSQEFADEVRADGWQIVQLTEEAAPWQARTTDEVLNDAARLIAKADSPPSALVNFGRASLPGGITNIAEAFEGLLSRNLVSAAIPIIGPPGWSARIFDDKWLTYQSLTKHGFPCPLTEEITPESVRRLKNDLHIGRFPLPAVLKVTNLTGGAGMRLVSSPDDLEPAIADLASLERPLILTEFLSGDEISIDVLRLGNDTLVFPPGLKQSTDRNLSHADHKIKVNGLLGAIDEISDHARRIAEIHEIQGFLSIEGVVLDRKTPRWAILEGAARVTNNFQMQNASLGFRSFLAISRFLQKNLWLPEGARRQHLALSLPVYLHHGARSLKTIEQFPWVMQAKIENLAEMPLSTDSRSRLTVKFVPGSELMQRCASLAAATGDSDIPGRVFSEIDRLRRDYTALVVNEDV
jgi:hypothetical protein